MLQIRLSKGGGGSSGDGGGAPGGKSAAAGETVTVACPEHLVLAELPVAKCLGAVTASAIRSVGRRSRRHLGERAHFCVRCDFPIAIYGRIMPCEHTFCLACVRSDISCYLCDERIQKIQTIKFMEGIYICAAPHCLKSFLKRPEFEAHIHETHADLIHSNVEKEVGNENNAVNNLRPSSADAQKQSQQPDVSTACVPPKPGFSSSSNSPHQDWEERSRHHQSRDPPPPRPPLQLKPPPFQSQQPAQSGDSQFENPQQGFERPYSWFPQPPTGPPFHQNPDQFSADKATGNTPDNPFSNFPQLPHQLLNFSLPLNANQALVPTLPLPFAPFPTDGYQPYYAVPPEIPRQDSVKDSGSEQGSVLGVPPPPTAIGGFPDNLSRPWAGMGFMGVQFQPLQIGQGFPEGFTNPMDPQAGVAFFHGDFGQTGMAMNAPLPGKESEHQDGLSADCNDGKGVMAPQPPSVAPPLPLSPPPPMPPPLAQQQQQQQQQQINRSRDFPPEFGWPNDKRGPD